MSTLKIQFSLEDKKSILAELFKLIVNPDEGLAVNKCAMMDWYTIRPGLRNGSETVFYGIREHDGALCMFEQLPHGTDSSDKFHVFDKHPAVELVPKKDTAGFGVRIRDRDTVSQNLNNEIAILNEIKALYSDFIKIYQKYIDKAKQ